MIFDKSKFIDQFKTETVEHLEKLELGLVKLERAPGDKELLNSLMREAHTIKGSATMMGYKRISDIAHTVEDAFQKLLEGSLDITAGHYTALFKCLDAIKAFLDDKLLWEDKGIEYPFAEKLRHEVSAMFGVEPSSEAETVIFEALPPKHAAVLDARPAGGAKETSIRVDIEKLDKLMNLSGEQLISRLRLDELINILANKVKSREDLEDAFGAILADLKKVNKNIDSVTSSIQSEVMDVRMVPISALFNVFPRAMRNLAQAKHKEIDFEIKGEETTLDKAIIEEMKDPVMHLLRNAIDHGIELPEARKAKNKPPLGKVALSAYQVGAQVVIEVSDDGRGIDVEKVKEIALAKKLIAKDRLDEMVDDQIIQFIFTPGFSTSKDVTETSGRGVGLDVVRASIGALKGIIDVVSKADTGTRFIMKLPLTLAVTESLIVAAGDEVFAIPIERVAETVRVNPDGIRSVEGRDAITVRGHILPLVKLNSIFNLPAKGIVERAFIPVIIVQSAEKKVGLLVDRLLGRQEIVGKAIGEPLGKIKNIAGATIMGDGRVVLILDIPSIISFGEGLIMNKAAASPGRPAKTKKKKTILLAEDSMSTAMLEKNILESVGYSVVIARDGREALERAAHEKFDLIISDILMPRMDGFELTTRLKKDKFYKDIPIIIVTTRESDADKRRGLECGADAYLLKSEFTSDTLLDTIERLVG